MRFKIFSPQVMEDLWSRWEYSVERILIEFNEDVFSGRGCIRKNSVFERPYVAVEARNRFVCIFPIQGNLLVFILFRGTFKKEYLSLDYAANDFAHDDLIGFDRLKLLKAERLCATSEERIQCLQMALGCFYRKYWSALCR